MDFEFILHLLCILGAGICTVTLISYLLFRKVSVFQKINASIYILALGIYLCFSEKLTSFVLDYYSSHYQYNYIMLIVSTISVITGVILVLIGNFWSNKKFTKYAYRLFEAFMLFISIAFIISSLTSTTGSTMLVPLLLLLLVFSEHFIVNSTESLQDKTSKLIYFAVNSVIGLFWLIGVIALVTKSSFSANGAFVFMLIIALAISLSSIIFGIFRINKKEN